MRLKISPRIQKKLDEKHGVTTKELLECFENRRGADLFDTRAEHRTDPLTRWFLAHTNHCRLLKIVFIPRGDEMEIKSVFEPNEEEIRIYKKYGLGKL
ncbi:MAG TPA: DUF4258 domain-containing protein [Rhodanobacter sp.]|nr:DUF4258 domain-containing protein [Rhodanobacter sp.]